MPEHYFTPQPGQPRRERELRVTLAGVERILSTDSGIFSPDGLDKGTAVLLENVPEPPTTGTLLDIGCGWGPIALTLALKAPHAQIYAVDVNERALELTRKNATMLGVDNLFAGTVDDVDPQVKFDAIWSNPPIRIGKTALHDLLKLWLPRLRPGGAAYLVVQKNLGSDSLQRWLNEEFPMHHIDRLTTAKGFRVLEFTRPIREDLH